MAWVASALHTTSEHGVSSVTTADAHISAASSRLNWRPRRFKWTRPFRRKTKFGFWACAITFQLASNCPLSVPNALTAYNLAVNTAEFQYYTLGCDHSTARGNNCISLTPTEGRSIVRSSYKHVCLESICCVLLIKLRTIFVWNTSKPSYFLSCFSFIISSSCVYNFWRDI